MSKGKPKTSDSMNQQKMDQDINMMEPPPSPLPHFLRNPNIKGMDRDVLYHLALDNKTNNLKEMFSDVKFVCFGGSPKRMEKFAFYLVDQLHYKLMAGHTLFDISHGSDRYVLYKVGPVISVSFVCFGGSPSRMKKFAFYMVPVDELKLKLTAGQTLCDISGGSDRYVLYKAGPVISVSHGMGIPSLSILMHEILKLLYHAGCEPDQVTFFRIGTSGGLGLDPGTVVISEAAVDGILRPYMEIATLGMIMQHPAFLNPDLNNELLEVSKECDCKAVLGKTMCTYDFYEGQARLDGAFCDYSKEDKMRFLSRAHGRGIANIEMESLCFAAMTHRAGVKSAVLCVTLLDRLKGDQIDTPHEIMEEWQSRPQKIVASYIKKKLGIQ